MDYNKVEDAVLKKAMEFFKDNAVKFFGIDMKIIAPAETEIKNIDIKTNYTDYLYYTDDGNYLHFEFQTTDKKDDLKRFLYYDASLFYKDKRKVTTIVVYSADIYDVETFIDAGSIKYSIKAFYMSQLDGDEKLEYLARKIECGDHLTNQDILALTFLPLMKGKETRSDRTIKSIQLAEKILDDEEKLKCLTLLYALFEKFGDVNSREKFMGVISMTEIGKMLKEEGKAEGKAEGKVEGKVEGKIEGKSEILIIQLIKKFKSVPTRYKENIKKLSDETIDVIATEIFDIESLSELEKYFEKDK